MPICNSGYEFCPVEEGGPICAGCQGPPVEDLVCPVSNAHCDECPDQLECEDYWLAMTHNC